MEHFLVGLAMLAPAIFIVLLLAGGIIIVSAWAYALLPPVLKGNPPDRTVKTRKERRSGHDRRHGMATNIHRNHTAAT